MKRWVDWKRAIVRPALVGGWVASLLLTTVGLAAAQAPQGATLTVLRGTVGVLRSNGSPVQPAGSGMSLGVGDQIATIGSAGALVTFFEGTELELGDKTTIILREVQSSGTEVHVTVEDVLGSAVGRVQAFVNPNSSYKLQSPGGQTVALIRGSRAKMIIFENSARLVAVDQCTKTCEIFQDGKSIFEGTGEAAFSVDSNGGVSSVSQGSVDKQELENPATPGGGGGTSGDSNSDGGGGGGSEPGYGFRGDTPLAGEWERLRSGDGLNPFTASGSLLTLGMLGLTFVGRRRR